MYIYIYVCVHTYIIHNTMICIHIYIYNNNTYIYIPNYYLVPIQINFDRIQTDSVESNIRRGIDES